MLYRVQGAVMMLLGAVSMMEGWRIAREAREGANFDAIGPDRYLMALSVAMMAIGLVLALRPPSLRQEQPANAVLTGSGSIFLFTMTALAGLTLLLPYLGFTIGSLLFLAVMFRRCGGWSWARSSLVASLVAAVFYVAFIRLAEVPLPSGVLGF